ncbi:MAG: glutamine-hydrolyzing GMP synthase subunit GuaA, partial [Thermoproteota archaeon]
MRRFNVREFIGEKISLLKSEIGGETAIVALSGGVDSSVTAVLGFKAVGKNLRAVFLEDGFMRIGEAERVCKAFSGIGINVKVYDVQKEFLESLKGIRDAEEKRKA